MALCMSGHEDAVDFSDQDQDEEYVCLPIHESTKQQEDDEEAEPGFSRHGRYKQDEQNEDMDEEQQILYEGSYWLIETV